MQLFAAHALLPDGWREDVALTAEHGRWTEVRPAATPGPGAVRLRGPAVPGLPNLHSHSFQRAMAGLAEAGGGDFWGWREVMYRFVARLRPQDVASVTAQLAVELLERGATTLGEFHYLCRQPGGAPYDDPAEMAQAVASGAAEAGIALCLLPAIYERGGFDGRPLEGGQLRFRQDADTAIRVAERMAGSATVGIAPHSLRAVRPESLRLDGIDPAWPVHVHVAEQAREVAECLHATGARPAAWLLDHAAVDPRWCLVHATHTDDDERRRIAAHRATVALCPATEANLGDGIFPAASFLADGGRFGVGTDSHVCTDMAEELRLLEYGQRLTLQRRTVLATPGRSTGRTLFDYALAGGAVLGHPAGIATGERADLVVLDGTALRGDARLDHWIFGPARRPVRDVFVAGRQVVSEGRHVAAEAIRARFRRTTERLADAL